MSMSFTRGRGDSMVFESKNTLGTLGSGETGTGEASSLRVMSDNPLLDAAANAFGAFDDGPLGTGGPTMEHSADRLDTRESDMYNGSQMARSLGGSAFEDVKESRASRQSTVVDGRDYYYGQGTGAFANYHQGGVDLNELDAKSEHVMGQHMSNSTDGRHDSGLGHS